MSSSSILVCGRGTSLTQWKSMRHKKAYLVNNMSEEVGRIGFDTTAADEIVHVAGRKGATVMTVNAYERLFVNRIVVNARNHKHICNIKRYRNIHVPIQVRPVCMEERGYEPIGWKNVLLGRDGKRKSDNGRAWPTTGLFAIDLALVENNPSEIHLYGFDFYRQRYLIKKNRSYQTQKNPKVRMMYVHLRRLVEEFKDTRFYCASSLGIEAPNWEEI